MSRHLRVDEVLVEGGQVLPSEGTAHHLVRVLRVAVGNVLTVVDADGQAFSAVVARLAPLTLSICGRVEGDSHNPATLLTVWLPLLKGGRTGDLIRTLTELGATKIIPYSSAHSVVKLDPKKAAAKLKRWRSIAAESTRQCGRTDLPAITDVVSGAGRGEAAGQRLVFWERTGQMAREVLASLDPKQATAILVGPEGGLSEAEVEELRAAGWRSAWLGPRILRAETAVMAGATLTLSALGESGY